MFARVSQVTKETDTTVHQWLPPQHLRHHLLRHHHHLHHQHRCVIVIHRRFAWAMGIVAILLLTKEIKSLQIKRQTVAKKLLYVLHAKI